MSGFCHILENKPVRGCFFLSCEGSFGHLSLQHNYFPVFNLKTLICESSMRRVKMGSKTHPRLPFPGPVCRAQKVSFGMDTLSQGVPRALTGLAPVLMLLLLLWNQVDSFHRRHRELGYFTRNLPQMMGSEI